ncbi:MAG: type IX secretion system membrane protein PorP/SprF [Bacteroidales bacterium]|nr:type IX secretion system membrane protein PorP/SprF [Bacteroidales bacterium]
MKKLLTALLLLMTTSFLFAQQDALFSQYMFNKLAVNPGYAGSRELLSADMIYRYQWVNIEGAPKTVSFALHSPLNNPHLALGFNLSNDKIGPLSNTSAMATFAYRIIFPKSKLSFGLQAGVKSNDVLWSKFNVKDAGESFMEIGNQVENKVIPDANFGVYYYSDRFYAGVSARQLLQNQSLLSTDQLGNTQFSKLATHFYAMTGAAFPINDNVVFRPSLLAKFVNNAPPQLDLNASFLFANTLWVGASYRTEKAISLITEVNIAQNLRIGYSYDIWMNELQSYNKGSHEIRISFDFNVGKRILTPRYF